jgi:multiple sugar transport system ATP-binding protein
MAIGRAIVRKPGAFVLNACRIEQAGAPMDLYHHPVNQFVAGFIGSPKMNFIGSELLSPAGGEAIVHMADGSPLPVPADATAGTPGSRVTVGISPEHVLATAQPGVFLNGRVEVAERLGDMTFLYVAVPGAEHDMVIRADADNPLHVGDTAYLTLPADRCHLFDADGQAFPRTR